MTLFAPQTPNLPLAWDNSHGTCQSLKLIVSQSGLPALLLLCSSISCPQGIPDIYCPQEPLLVLSPSTARAPGQQQELFQQLWGHSSPDSWHMALPALPSHTASLLLSTSTAFVPPLFSSPATLGLWKNQLWFGFEYVYSALLWDDSWRMSCFYF